MKQYKFSVEDIKKFAKSMVVLVDSREKKNSHIIDYFKKQGISYKSEKLDYGDYSFMIPAVAAGEDIKAQEIREMVDAKKGEEKEKCSIAEQKADQMSDTDTNEEEKENARRLHALKMLEKYYIYMSDEEVGILERMLEDCKRRKREYGLDDVGSTV